MSFSRFVQIGRVALINFGEDAGKICTIVDVIDGNRVLVDGPDSGVARKAVSLKRIQLTDITVPIKLNASQKCAAALSAAFHLCQPKGSESRGCATVCGVLPPQPPLWGCQSCLPRPPSHTRGAHLLRNSSSCPS
jgi:ribosomal protein L14E/L6E/L27E